jgi:myo-inositol-1-phosphate synthase
MKKNIKVAIAGVGCCASSLVQFVYMVKETQEHEKLFGVMYDQIGGYHISDIEFVCAFDVNKKKIGIDLKTAIFTEPNIAKEHFKIPLVGIKVEAGPLLDGISGDLSKIIQPHDDCYKNDLEFVVKRLKETQSDMLVCYLPTGAAEAVQLYANAALIAGVAFINATPEVISRNEKFVSDFFKKSIPLLGDDIKSHLGATTLHTAIIELMHSRGIKIVNTYQLNFGGNMDFLNLSSHNRSITKQISKKNALFAAGIDASKVSAGPNGYIEYLGDDKICYLRLEGNSVLNSNISIELRLQVEDSPNSAGVMVNALRIAKVAKDNRIGGTIDDVCSFLFKSPKVGTTESNGLNLFKNFIDKYSTCS